MKTIIAVGGQRIDVDDLDYDVLAKNSWYINAGYAARKIKHPDGYPGKTVHAYMHRLLCCLIYGDKMSVDHINGNKLDNRRCNLRVCTHAENQRNKPIRKNNKSGYKGVSWDAKRNKWYVSIRVNEKTKSIGHFFDKEKAFLEYCEAAKKFHGDFANFGDEYVLRETR